MLTVIRVARVVLTLVIAVITVSLVTAVARPETGVVEKAVLLAVVVGCVGLVARLATWSARAAARFTRP